MAPPDAATTTTTGGGSPTSSKRRRRLLLHEAGAIEAAAAAAAAAGKDNDPASAAAAAAAPALTVSLDSGFEQADLRLMEAPPELLAALEAGQALRLVGGGREQAAALVTEDATYELCRVETSNMILLVPPLPPGAQGGAAVGNATFHYELKKSKPKVEELKRLLAASAAEGKAWALAELEQACQGSQAEIVEMLEDMNAIEEAPGLWRSVDEAQVNPTLDRLLSEVISEGLSLDALREDDCLRMMQDVDPALVRYCLRAYGTRASRKRAASFGSPLPVGGQEMLRSPSPSSSGGVRIALDMDKIARFKAHQIFAQGVASGRAQGAAWPKDAFLLEWEASMPDAHKPDPALLRGIALGEMVGEEDSYVYLPAEGMPLDPVARLRRLFAARKKWSLEDLAPYLRGLVPEKDIGDFLMKHARAAGGGANGARTYSAK